MNTIKIGEKEFGFKLTLESWKRLKEAGGITPSNIQKKIEEDIAGVVSSIVFYGLSPDDRKVISQEIIDQNIDLSIVKDIVPMIEASLSKDDGPKN
jgi:hypothetical protein